MTVNESGCLGARWIFHLPRSWRPLFSYLLRSCGSCHGFFFWLRCCNLRKKARGVLLIRLISPSGHGTNELRGEEKEGGELSLCKNILFFPSFLKPREEFLFTTLKVLSKSCLKGVPFFFSCFSSCKIKYLFIINYTVFFLRYKLDKFLR